MREGYERTLQHSFLVVELDQIYEEDYQMKMLSDNSISGLLEVKGQGEDDRSKYRYDVTGKLSLKELWEKEKWGYAGLEAFMRQMIQVLYELGSYLLDLNNLSLKPEHIYKGESQFYFCYIPGLNENIWRSFHVLMEEFVREMDYSDKEGIYLAYELHRASMEENYDVEQVLEQILERKEQEMQRIMPPKRKMVYDIAEEQILDDWSGKAGTKGKGIQERQSVWGFVSKKIRNKGL